MEHAPTTPTTGRPEMHPAWCAIEDVDDLPDDETDALAAILAAWREQQEEGS